MEDGCDQSDDSFAWEEPLNLGSAFDCAIELVRAGQCCTERIM
jgi:hypothetical protein